MAEVRGRASGFLRDRVWRGAKLHGERAHHHRPHPVQCPLARSDEAERKQAEEDLRESLGQFKDLFDPSVDSLFVHDPSGKIVDCNAEACRSLGYSREELLRLSVKDFATNLAKPEAGRLDRAFTNDPRNFLGHRNLVHKQPSRARLYSPIPHIPPSSSPSQKIGSAEPSAWGRNYMAANYVPNGRQVKP